MQQWRLIREREKYLSELAGERNLSHQMISSMHEGVVVLNIRREPVLMNPRAEHFLGTHFREGHDPAGAVSRPGRGGGHRGGDRLRPRAARVPPGAALRRRSGGCR